MSRSRRPGQAAASALALALLVAACGAADRKEGRVMPSAAAERPNVVVLMTDDQVNAELRVMPRVERLLADRGTELTRFYASYPLCCPSRTTFLTGQYAHNTGVQGNFPDTDDGGYSKLRGPSRTLPVWLQAAGYRTAVVGKWPELPPPGVPPGWDRWWTQTQPTIARYYDYSLNRPGGGTLDYGSRPSDYNTTVLDRIATRFIAGHARGRDPFFLWVTYTAPHFGFGRDDAASRRCGSVPGGGLDAGLSAVPAPRDARAFGSRPLPRPPSFNEPDVSDKPSVARPPRIRRADIRADVVRHRCRLASLLGVDRSVADVVGTLRRAGELRRTLILFTSDNGFMLGQHRQAAGKNLPYEEAVRVPLLVRGPGVEQGERLALPAVNTDLAPTILDAAGARQPRGSGRPGDGRSLLPLLTGRHRPPPDRAILIEGRDDARERPDGTYTAVSYQGVRTARYLYVRWHRSVQADREAAVAAPIGAGPPAGEELYDMRRDPGQLDSVAGDRRYAAVRRALAGILAELEDCRGRACEPPVRLPALRR